MNWATGSVEIIFPLDARSSTNTLFKPTSPGWLFYSESRQIQERKMSGIVTLPWKPITPPETFTSQQAAPPASARITLVRPGRDPYNSWPVVLYMNREVFQASWVGEEDGDFDPVMKTMGYSGYWLGFSGKVWPPVPCYWCQIDQRPHRENLRQTALDIQASAYKDRMVVARDTGGASCGWATVEYHEGKWTDIYGNTQIDSNTFGGLIINLPGGYVSEEKQVKGPAGLPWQ